MFLIAKSWYELLKNDFESKEYQDFTKWLNLEYHNYTIYPEPKNVFNALNLVPYDKVKVVIIGQDPYHGPHQAHGLSFSVEGDVAIPPSLQNIFKELKNDVGCYIPNNGNLTSWAKQGVLLLNSVLTVRAGCPNSHKGKYWEKLTRHIVQLLNDREDPCVFLLWGGNAKAMAKYITNTRHLVLMSAHPSPMSANQGGWFGNHHFSKTNEFLISYGKTPINWQIENK